MVRLDRPTADRLARIAAATATGVLMLLATAQTIAIYRGAELRGEVGFDANVYAYIGAHFLATGQAYFPFQSAPYEAIGIANFYPPTALYLFVPASLLPRAMWWLVPLALIGWSLYRLRTAWWAWPVMALACVVPLSGPAVPVALVYGNTLLWMLAALFTAAAFRPGIAWAVMIKPVDLLFALPFALLSRRAFGVTVVLSAVLLPLWFDWLIAMQNLDSSPLRGMPSWPALAAPLVAWAARRGRLPTRIPQTAAATSDGRTAPAPSS